MDETVAYSSLKHTRSRKAMAVPYFEDLKARRGRGCGWRVVLTWRMDGYMRFRSDHLRETAGGVVMQCDIWVVFRVSISSDCKDTTRGEKQKQFFAGVMRTLCTCLRSVPLDAWPYPQSECKCTGFSLCRALCRHRACCSLHLLLVWCL